VVAVTETDGTKYETGFTDQGAADLNRQLEAAQNAGNIKSFDIEPRKSSALLGLLTYVLPFVIFIAFWIFLMNQVQGGGSKVMSFGKSRAKRMSVDSLGPGLMSFWAKNARTTTMRMGNAALLKNLLMRGTRTAFASLGKGLRVPGALRPLSGSLRDSSADGCPSLSRATP